MSITTDYTATEVKCPCCRIQPLNVEFDWGNKLKLTMGRMPCCNGHLTLAQVNDLLTRIVAARGARG
jgi:hypothetical protein